MGIDIAATRHPALPVHLLVGVQDDNGPLEGLSQEGFAVFAHAWATAPPDGAFDPAGRFDLPVVAAHELVAGIYALELGRRPVRDDSEALGAEDIGASVFGVSVIDTHANTGIGIATTPIAG